MPIKFLFPVLFSLASLTGAVSAQQFEDFGTYEVHYSAMNTSLLSPEVARAYDIQRSGNRAMLNITILDKSGDGWPEPISARVEASAINLTGQRRAIELREIRDQGAIYYIGTFRITNEENMNFRVTVQPAGDLRPREFSFRQMFYVL